MLMKGITAASVVFAVLKTVGEPLWMLPVYFLAAFALLFAAALVFLLIICGLVDMKKEQEHDSKFYRAMMYLYIDALIAIFRVRVKASGLEKTPADGRFLLVCNHQHMADPGILLSFFKKSQLAFISKKENEKLPIINKFLHKIMCQSIDREDDRQALRVILKCIQMIKEDQVSVGVFPEGYTSRDGKLHHFRSGVFKIAQKTGVPIVVCTIQGTGPLFHNIARLKPTHVQLHLVDVISPEELKGKKTTEISEMVYEMMIADMGEEYRADPV